MHKTAIGQADGVSLERKVLCYVDWTAREILLAPEEFDAMLAAYARHGWSLTGTQRPLSRRHAKLWRIGADGTTVERRYLIELAAVAS